MESGRQNEPALGSPSGKCLQSKQEVRCVRRALMQEEEALWDVRGQPETIGESGSRWTTRSLAPISAEMSRSEASSAAAVHVR